ncbi:hypothetical protein CRE_21586 [Caenorhabditis remanei]|uniref:Uncharacterized protein n=1 Tax=Caenorhabditis remanei TaxID=31234 RepID=E3NJV1_CAERE|nr:hypothetical protein CRE_21586 [Caenorhabditis remanei]
MIGEKNYSFPFDYQHADRGTHTDPKNSQAEGQKGSSPGWKVAIAIISVLGIILIVAFIVYYMRNRFPRIKTHVRPPFGERVENEYGMGHMPGSLTQVVTNGDSYVKVFRSFPHDLKVDFKRLRVDKLDPDWSRTLWCCIQCNFILHPKVSRAAVEETNNRCQSNVDMPTNCHIVSLFVVSVIPVRQIPLGVLSFWEIGPNAAKKTPPLTR